MKSQVEMRVRAIERRVAKQRPQGTIIVIKTEGKYSLDGRRYKTLEELRETNNLQDAKLIVFLLRPSKWRPN